MFIVFPAVSFFEELSTGFYFTQYIFFIALPYSPYFSRYKIPAYPQSYRRKDNSWKFAFFHVSVILLYKKERAALWTLI